MRDSETLRSLQNDKEKIMDQLAGQLSLYDIFTQNVPIGFIGEEHKGRKLKFQELEDYVGKRVVISRSTTNSEYYSVVTITSYHKNAGRTYKLKNNAERSTHGYPTRLNEYIWSLGMDKDEYAPDYFYDQIGYSDDKRNCKENSWVGEIYCSNGRHEPIANYPENFYEYAL